MRNVGLALTGFAVAAVLIACSGSNNASGFGEGQNGGGAGGGGGGGGGGLVGGNGTDGGGGGGGGMTGQVDKTAACDTGLAIDGDATSFAKSIGICTDAMKDGYGLVSASYQKGFNVTAAPVNGQWGILPKFGSGIKPREGAALGALSSGVAREYDDTGSKKTDFVPGKKLYSNDPSVNPFTGMVTGTMTGQPPPGFPKAAKGCKQDNNVNDMIDVKLTLTAPKDATGFQFDFDFYSSEWPDYVCSNFNDAFVAYLTSSTVKGDNISFDSNNNPVAVNINFLNRCGGAMSGVGCASDPNNPGMPTGQPMCNGGTTELAGTGFGDMGQTSCGDTSTAGGATGWLTTQAPVMPGETFTLEFMVWDAGDGILDSSVLIDNFQWIGGTVSTGTQRVN